MHQPRRLSGRPFWVAVVALAAVLAGLALPAAAQDGDRQLRWRRFDVAARLDARGDLHVRETQVMVMTGDWNGGERRFRLGPGQALRFEGLYRLAGPGTAVPLVRGDLDEIDRYSFADETTLRWRSRRHVDPPYADTELTFVLEYTLARVLVDAGEGRFQLSHDFAFADRPGVMERVTARLTLDPAWQAETSLEPGAAELALEANDLPPGSGAVLTVPLRFVGTGPAPEAYLPPPPPPGFPEAARLPLLLALAAALALAFAWVRRDARARGLLAAPEPRAIDERWLAEHLYAIPPEVVGAAYDDTVGSPEVSATLARMTAEGKLEVSVTSSLLGLLKVVHLRLKVDRQTLRDHERRLVDGLFVAGDSTDSNVIRRHYSSRGFDPSTRIAPELDARVRQLHQREAQGRPPGPGAKAARWPRWLALLLLAGGLVLGGLAVLGGEHPVLVFAPAVAGLLLALFARAPAARLAKAVDGRGRLALLAAIPLLAWLGLVALVASGAEVDGVGAGLHTVLEHALLWCAGVVSTAGAARSVLHAGQVGLRLRLAAARRHLARELDGPAPRLRDEAIPYLIALGLGRGLDRWLRVHGPSAAGPLSRTRSVGGSSSSDGLSGGGASWTGGGGAFSGGGASGSWAALASVASGVPAPSSSSSSGSSSSSSSSSSSGGGGGGGW